MADINHHPQSIHLAYHAFAEFVKATILTYFIAHEAHHRGQIVMVARQTGHRLPGTVTGALWQWKWGNHCVDWIAYGITRQTAKDNEHFGEGDIRGVIGPESANNAKEGGALVPTLLFGIPGSGTTAMLLGGLLLMGVQAGPVMVRDRLDITLAIVWSLALANILGTGACLLLSGYVAKLSLIPARKLVPFLLVVMTVAAYQATRHWGDILAFLVIGAIGWIMKQVGWPRAPMLIGFVLAPSAERYLHLSMSLYGYDWLYRPLVLLIGALTFFVVFGSQIIRQRKLKRQAREREVT